MIDSEESDVKEDRIWADRAAQMIKQHLETIFITQTAQKFSMQILKKNSNQERFVDRCVVNDKWMLRFFQFALLRSRRVISTSVWNGRTQQTNWLETRNETFRALSNDNARNQHNRKKVKKKKTIEKKQKYYGGEGRSSEN